MSAYSHDKPLLHSTTVEKVAKDAYRTNTHMEQSRLQQEGKTFQEKGAISQSLLRQW